MRSNYCEIESVPLSLLQSRQNKNASYGFLSTETYGDGKTFPCTQMATPRRIYVRRVTRKSVYGIAS